MKVLVIGAAVSGRAAALLARDQGHEVLVYDRAADAIDGLESEGFATAAGAWEPRLLEGADLVVTSPGVAEHAAPLIDAEQAGVVVWSELEFGTRHLDASYIAVTGTNGKSTVTGTAAAMLSEGGLAATAAGNIGTPVSSIVDRGFDVVVVEASSFQLRFIDRFHPQAAAIINVAPDHLDWHRTKSAYAAAKARIFENMNGDDRLAFDVDDTGAATLAAAANATLIPISGRMIPKGGAGIDGTELVVGEHRYPLPTADPSYAIDLAFAAVLASTAGATPEGIERALAAFTPGPHRREVVGTWAGITWIDDSKATNPHAARAAASSYDPVILIAGGRNKGLDLAGMVPATVRRLIAYGEAGREIAATTGAPATVVKGFDDAVAQAAQAAEPGDVVLLAPGCASFDQFSSYIERGERFAVLARAQAAVTK